MRKLATVVVALVLSLPVVLVSEFVASGAPVPKGAGKPPKPEKLTNADLAGRWDFEWSTPGSTGWMEFDESGSYSCKTADESPTLYYGTYTADGNAIVLTEWRLDTATGNVSQTPSVYRLEFDVKDWPSMAGKATGAIDFNAINPPRLDTHTKLHGRKRNRKP